jgi:hypothetical protein
MNLKLLWFSSDGIMVVDLIPKRLLPALAIAFLISLAVSFVDAWLYLVTVIVWISIPAILLYSSSKKRQAIQNLSYEHLSNSSEICMRWSDMLYFSVEGNMVKIKSKSRVIRGKINPDRKGDLEALARIQVSSKAKIIGLS